MSWTVEQVLGLAPDARAAGAGRAIGSPRRWRGLGRRLDAAWGEYQGSAAQPYRVTVDLSGPAFACTCPSSKVPCKHALGLMLLAAAEPTTFGDTEPPEWVAEWLARRRQRQERDLASQARTPEQVAQQQQRTQRREARIGDGVDELDRWLQDLVRGGLAEAASRPWSAFEQMSARLVDAQAPGLARLVRDIGAQPHRASNWPERMLIDVGQLALLLEAWRRIGVLEPGLQAEVRSLVGINESRDSVLARPPVRDVWDALGRRVLEGERMRVQRTWLWGRQTRRWALLLDFSVAGQPIEQSVTPGLSFEADLCFYAGALPLRAIVRNPPDHAGPTLELPAHNGQTALEEYAAMLARSPWLERAPMVLAQVIPLRGPNDAWWLVDDHDRAVRLNGAVGWQVLALSGGQPVEVFGEWDGFSLVPLSVLVDNELRQLRWPVAA